MLKQRCKRRRFELNLTRGDSTCELALLDRKFAHDVVTVVGGPSGAAVISIPRQLYIDTARSARRQIILERVAALAATDMFHDINETQLGRLALGAMTQLCQNGQCLVKQGESPAALFVVVRGTFVRGRCLHQSGENVNPVIPGIEVMISGSSEGIKKERERERIEEGGSRRTQRRLSPCITVGHEERGGYFGEEAILSSMMSTLGASSTVVKDIVASREDGSGGGSGGGGGGGGGGGVPTKLSWSTVVCSGAGEILLLSPSLLKVVGVELHKQTLERIGVSMSMRPKDPMLMRRITMRQEMQKLKKSLIGDELPL